MDSSTDETTYTRYETHAYYRNATFEEDPFGPSPSTTIRGPAFRDTSALQAASMRDTSFRDSALGSSNYRSSASSRDMASRGSTQRGAIMGGSSYRDSSFRDAAYRGSAQIDSNSNVRDSSFRDAAYTSSRLGTNSSARRDSTVEDSSFRDAAYTSSRLGASSSARRDSTPGDSSFNRDSFTRDATYTSSRLGISSGLYDSTLHDSTIEDSIFTAPRASSYTFPVNSSRALPGDSSSSSSDATPRETSTYTTPRDSSYTTARDANYATFGSSAFGNETFVQGSEGEQFYDPLPPYIDAAGGSGRPAKGSSKRWIKAQSKIGWPVNKAANLVGAEGFWPSHMEKECMKAARILHSFTGLGFPYPPKKNAPMHPLGLSKKSMILIPTAVLSNCAGLAIFNVVRAGAIHGSLAGGSGVVVARRADGTWSPPSSFLVSTLGGGFMIGLDIYDCICVLNTVDQLRAFTNPRFSLGGEASVAFGPLGTGASLDAAVSRTARPMWTYMKSRGIWAGIQIDGTIIVTRPDCNAVFYNEKGITAKKILRGNLAWPEGGRALYDVLKCIDDPHAYNRLVWEEDGDDQQQQQQQQQQGRQEYQNQQDQQQDQQQSSSLAGPIRSRDRKGDVKDSTEVVDEEFFADDPFVDDPFGDEHVASPPPAESSSRNMTLLDGF